MLSSVGARSSHPNSLPIPVGDFPISLLHPGVPHSICPWKKYTLPFLVMDGGAGVLIY
jgi:hypothetical protein